MEFAPQFESLLAEVLQESGEPVKTSSATTVTRRHVPIANSTSSATGTSSAVGTRGVFCAIRQEPERMEACPGIQTRGIAVVPHLAHGERWDGTDCWKAS